MLQTRHVTKAHVPVQLCSEGALRSDGITETLASPVTDPSRFIEGQTWEEADIIRGEAHVK